MNNTSIAAAVFILRLPSVWRTTSGDYAWRSDTRESDTVTGLVYRTEASTVSAAAMAVLQRPRALGRLICYNDADYSGSG